MKPEDIGKAYNQITHLWQRKDFNHDNGIAQHQRAIAFVRNKGAALDVGCGCTGRFIELLFEKGFDVEGLDISSEMLQLVKEKHPNVTFFLADICEWEPPKKYDFITAWDSIWHIPLSQQQAVLAKLLSSLNSGGVCIFSFGGLDEPNEHVNSAMGPEVYYSTLGVTGFLKVISQSGCVRRHLEYDQYPELHTYIIAQRL